MGGRGIMRKYNLIILALILIILGISFWNVTYQQEVFSLKKRAVTLSENNKKLTETNEYLVAEKEQLESQVTVYSQSLKKLKKRCISSKVDIDLNETFVKKVNKLFEASLNFTPENYKDRKQEITDYLSEELRIDYFGQNRSTYQEANDTFSKLESLEVYPNVAKNNTLDGLVVIHYKSKKTGCSWVNGMNIFKVKFDNESNKFVDIINLGNSFYE